MSLSTIRRRFDSPLSTSLHSSTISAAIAGGGSSSAIKRSQTEPVKNLPVVDDDREQRQLRRRTTLIFDRYNNEEPLQSQPAGDEPCSPTSLLSFSTRSLMAAGGQTFSDYIYNNLRRKTTALASGGGPTLAGNASSMMNLSAARREEAKKPAEYLSSTNMNVLENSTDSDDRQQSGDGKSAVNSSAARASSILSSFSSSSISQSTDSSMLSPRPLPLPSSIVSTSEDSPTLLRQLRHAKEMGYTDTEIMAALEANAEKGDDSTTTTLNPEKKRSAFRRFASINTMVDTLNVVQMRLHAERLSDTDGGASTSGSHHYHKRASASGSKCNGTGEKLLSASTNCLATIPDDGDVDALLPASGSGGGWRRYLRKSRLWKSKASSSKTSIEKAATHPPDERDGVGEKKSASTLTLNGLEPGGIGDASPPHSSVIPFSWRHSTVTQPLARDSAISESSSNAKSSPSASVSSATSFCASAGPPTVKYSTSFTNSETAVKNARSVTRSASYNTEAARPSATDMERSSKRSDASIYSPYIPPCDVKSKQKLASKSSAVQRLLGALECENRRAADAFCRANEELKRQLNASVVDADRLRDALRQRRDEAERQKRGALDAQRRIDAANRRVDEMAKELRARDAEIMRLVNELSAQRRQNDTERRKAEETRSSLDAEITRLIDENANAEASFRENSALRAELAEKEQLLNEIMTASTSGGCLSLSSAGFRAGCSAGTTSSTNASADAELALLRERCVLLERENRDLSERHARAATCGVCMDHRREVIFMPCLHFTCCKSCADAMDNCSICRLRIMGRIEFFQ